MSFGRKPTQVREVAAVTKWRLAWKSALRDLASSRNEFRSLAARCEDLEKSGRWRLGTPESEAEPSEITAAFSSTFCEYEKRLLESVNLLNSALAADFWSCHEARQEGLFLSSLAGECGELFEQLTGLLYVKDNALAYAQGDLRRITAWAEAGSEPDHLSALDHVLIRKTRRGDPSIPRWRQIASREKPDGFKAWMRASISGLIRDRARLDTVNSIQRLNEGEILEDVIDRIALSEDLIERPSGFGEDQVERCEPANDIEDLFERARLSDAQKIALKAAEIDNLIDREIAERIGCKPSTARTHLQNARQKIRKLSPRR